MEKISELKRLTLELLTCTHILEKKLESVKKTRSKGDFYQEVKPFADNTKQLNDEWKKIALVWIEEARPKNLHIQQIESTHGHMEMISVQAFFPETSQARFKNMVASVKYILNNILIHLNEEEGEPS